MNGAPLKPGRGEERSRCEGRGVPGEREPVSVRQGTACGRGGEVGSGPGPAGTRSRCRRCCPPWSLVRIPLTGEPRVQGALRAPAAAGKTPRPVSALGRRRALGKNQLVTMYVTALGSTTAVCQRSKCYMCLKFFYNYNKFARISYV